MKQKYIFYLLIFMLNLPLHCSAQVGNSDTVTVKTSTYLVKKKKETIFSIANKLNLDMQTISLLNDSIPVAKVLLPGQKIIIPVTPAKEKGQGNVNQSNTVIKGDTIVVHKDEPVAKQSSMAIDTELIQNKILLADATLDLNRALLQGIEASLDSLNVKDKVVIDEKNISATIHHMQRQRDKAMLTPVLLHMRDSLKIEINREETEKQSFATMLGQNSAVNQVSAPPVKSEAVKDTAMAGLPDNVVVTESNAAKVETGTNKTDKADTVSQAVVKIKKEPGEPTHIRPVIEVAPKSEAASPPPVMHWETAKAIYFNDDTVAESKLSSTDTGAYHPGSGVQIGEPHMLMSDSSRVIRAQYFFTRALKASNEKNYKSAADLLKMAIDISPKYYDAWFALGEADAHLGMYTKALNEYAYCKTLDSSNASLYYKIGMAQLKLKQRAEAFSNFNRSLFRDSNYVPAIISRAGEYAERNQFKAAIREYARVIAIDPSYHTVYKAKAMAEYAVRNYSAAIDDFTRFLIFNETDGSVYYYRGLAKLKKSDLIDACTDLSVSARLGYPGALKALEVNCK